MNGVTAVALPSNMTRVYRVYVDTSGTYADSANGSHAGNIVVQESGGGAEWAKISVLGLALSQSLIGAYTIPLNKKGHIYLNGISVDGNKTADFFFFARENINDNTVPYSGIKRVKQVNVGVDSLNSLAGNIPIGCYPGGTDIGYFAKVASGTADVSVDFYIILEDY
jgi:hypothetical protein